MEARGKTQHRTQVKPCKAGPTWVSVPVNATPNFQPWSERYWGRWRREAFALTPGDLFRSASAVGHKKAMTRALCLRRSRITP